MKKAAIALTWTLLVVAVTLLIVRYFAMQIRNINDEEQMTALRSLYHCCQVFYADNGRAPTDSNELAHFCQAARMGVPFVSELSTRDISYFPVGNDRWVLVLMKPEANVKTVERNLKGGKYMFGVSSIQKGRVRQEQGEEDPADLFRPPTK